MNFGEYSFLEKYSADVMCT